ncbi:Two-component response regulator-like APRR9 [Hibiscus syriacus]|uniref:Two-component response regulator-like APRR9 n=1 Tax=Hibiscus syriacus TaxID=106335 RepID=A0A6A2YK53_HIBSY|nr:two-component response regulator-like APRR5 isoform X3 [Hibiscus syriacus]KAE8678247.1 Two-component response regulator-like APRR9 [Hibiscus syriacus]
MGDVVVSSEEVRIGSETEKENEELDGNLESEKEGEKRGSSASGAVVNWGRFLPMPALRVLLVEADDSTRQIIFALLRKCSYRVAAVSDGLKAWEMLKGRPHSVDLILTEVDLPSISGFALLTLIMEHDVCKNIPVIMMSSQDSVSTVYKCMLRGAADYLVKPIRRNELRNLWQHVWRRRSSVVGGNPSLDESVGQKKVEASSENDAACNHSIGCLAGVQTNKEQTEKGSDAQSSCTKPDMEAESTHKENMQEFSHLMKGKSPPIELQEHEAHASFNQNLLMHQMENADADSCKDAYTTTVHKDVELENQRRDTNILAEAGDVLVGSPREAIDFMGTFNKNWNSSINSARNFDSSPYLDLSLRRSNPHVSENVTQERPTFWHPNASAFMRYASRVSQPLHSTLMSFGDQKKDSETNSEKMLTNVISEYNSDTPSPTLTSQRSMIPFTTGATAELKQTEAAAAACTQQRVFPVPVPVKGIRLNNPCNGYNSITPPIYCARSSSSMQSPSSANQQEPAFCVNLFRHSSFEANSSGQLYDRLASNTNQSTNQPLHKLDSIEDRGHMSPNTDQSATSSFCNGSLSQLNGIAYGSTGASNGNVDQVAIGRASTESKNDESFPSPSGNSCRSIQREAALMKFRLKRKDRCYEKKVRYESRKKLAEQRPRVKGQFVRQVQANPTHTEAERHHGNSSDR